jgi:hypothetical protein
MNKVKKKIICPLCHGKGTCLKEYNTMGNKIRTLKKAGLTYREILKKTKLKSLDTVHYYLKGAGKNKS